MAVEYQNKSEVKVTANATSITIPVPTGFSAGDLLIAIVTKDDDPAIVLPTGGTWTLIQGGTGGDPQMHFSVSYRIAVAGDTSWTWTGDSEQWYGVILRYTGQASSGFIHASGKADGDSTTPTAPSVNYTDLEAGSIALHCFGQDYDRIPYTSPDALIERYNGEAGGCGGAGGDKATIIDSYSESNFFISRSINHLNIAISQSFTGTANKLEKATFYLQKAGSPTGIIVAKLYSHNGTYGSSSVPNTLLATSNTISLADIPTSYTLVDFEFIGANQYSLTNGTKYCIVLESDDCDVANYIRVGVDNSSPTHSGNYAQYITSWTPFDGDDVIFYVRQNTIDGSGSTGTAVFTTDAADEWLAVTVVIEAGIAGEQIKKVISEVLNISELKNYFRGRYKIQDEVVNIAESKNYLRTLTRIINEVIDIDELKIKLMTLLKVISETLNIEQAKNYIRGRLQVVSEVLNTVETIVKLVVVEGQDIIKVISETLNISELKNYIRNRLKVIDEVLNIGELKNKLQAKLRVIDETVNISEVKNYIRDRFKVISEIVNLDEAKNYIRGRLKIISETLNISELFNKVRGIVRVISEVVNIGELKNYIRKRFKIINETLNISELKNKLRSLTRIISDVVNVGKVIVKLQNKLRIINETLNIGETKNYIRGRLQVIDETLNISETIVKIVAGIGAIIKVINETLNISEAKNYLRSRFKIINETLNISETIVKLQIKIKVISETVNISELQNYIRGRLQVISEVINISEARNYIRGFFKVINETINIKEKHQYTYDFTTDDGKWDLSNANISGGVLDITANDGWGDRTPDNNWSSGADDDFTIQIDFKQDTTINEGMEIRLYLEGDTPISFDVYGGSNLMRIHYGGVLKASQTFVDDTAWHTVRIRRVGTTYYFKIDAGTELSWNYGTARAIEYIRLGMNLCTGDFDNFKYSWALLVIKLLGFIKVISETLNIEEAKNYLRSRFKIISEILNINEAKNYFRGRYKVINETINISEIKVKLRGFIKVVSETLNIAETIVKTIYREIVKVISEIINIVTLQNKLKGFIKIISETINISEAKNKIRGLIKIISEAINISELKKYYIRIWTAISKMSTIWTPKEKEDTTWSPESKEDTTWTPKDKEDTIWTP